MGHYYISEMGYRLPSVTTILQATQSDESRYHLDKYFSKGLAAHQHNHLAIERGNQLDAWAKAYVRGDSLPLVAPAFRFHLLKLKVALDGFKAEGELLSDVQLVSELLEYAGTADFIWLRPNQKFSIIDLKSRDYPSAIALEKAFLQCAGYASLYASLYGASLHSLIVATAMPRRCQVDEVKGAKLLVYQQQWKQKVRIYGIGSPLSKAW